MRKILFIAVLFFISHKAYADNYCLVDKDGKVVNLIAYDGESEYTPPKGTTLVPCPTQGRGWTYINKKWTAPPEPTDDEN